MKTKKIDETKKLKTENKYLKAKVKGLSVIIEKDIKDYANVKKSLRKYQKESMIHLHLIGVILFTIIFVSFFIIAMNCERVDEDKLCEDLFMSSEISQDFETIRYHLVTNENPDEHRCIGKISNVIISYETFDLIEPNKLNNEITLVIKNAELIDKIRADNDNGFYWFISVIGIIGVVVVLLKMRDRLSYY